MKIAIFSKKLLCKVPIFFIGRLGSETHIVYALDARSFTKWTMTSLCESAVLISVANGKRLVKYWISVHRFLQALQDEKKIDSEQSGSTTIDCVIEKTVQAVHVCSDKLWKWGWIWKLWTILENELRVIDDEEILNDLKFEITSAIYKAKNQWIAKKKASIVIVNNLE
jgi:hypothetical protein